MKTIFWIAAFSSIICPIWFVLDATKRCIARKYDALCAELLPAFIWTPIILTAISWIVVAVNWKEFL